MLTLPLLLLLGCEGCDSPTLDTSSPPDDTTPSTTDTEPERWSLLDVPELGDEPNDTPTDAVRLNHGALDMIAVGGDDDPVDWFVLQAGQAGRLTTFAYDVSDPAATVTVSHVDAELAVMREGLGEHSTILTEPGTVYVSVESDRPVTLLFGVNFKPRTPTIDAVSPDSAAPLSWLTLTGGEFGTAEEELTALVGGAVSEVRLVDPETVEVLVPYGARHGGIQLRVAGQLETASFTLSDLDRPEATWDEPETWDLTADGVAYAEDRLVVDLVADATDTDLADLLSGTAHEVVGWGPLSNVFQVQLSDEAGEQALDVLRDALLADPRVDGVRRVTPLVTTSLKLDSDPYPDHSYAGLHTALQGSGLADAWRLFHSFGGQATPLIQLAVVDTGLLAEPVSGLWSGEEFPDEEMPEHSALFSYHSIVEGSAVRRDRADWFQMTDAAGNPVDHGTLVSGVIGALNGRGVGNGHANGALAGFHRAGVDDDSDGTVDEDGESLPYLVDNFAMGMDGTMPIEDRLLVVAGLGYHAVNLSFGMVTAMTDDAFVTTASETVWVPAAGNHPNFPTSVKDTANIWPAKLGATHPTTVLTTAAANRVGSTPETGAWGHAGWSTTADDPTWYTFGGAAVRIAATEEFLAPGGSPSAGSGAYRLFNGTSACAPQVTAMVGLIRALRPELSAPFVTALVRGSGTDLTATPIGANWAGGAPVALPASTSVKRLHWTKLLVAELIQESPYLAVDTKPYLVVGNEDGTESFLRRVALDPATGLWDTAYLPEDETLVACRNPVAVEASPDGLRIAAVCSQSDTVEVWSLLGWQHVGSVELGGDVGAHGRATMTPDGLLLVPIQGGGAIKMAVVDVGRAELIGTVDVGAGAVVFGNGLLDTTGDFAGVLVSDNDPGRLEVVQLDGPGETLAHVPFDTVDLAAIYPTGDTPNGFALHPLGYDLAITWSGTPRTDLELTMLGVSKDAQENYGFADAPPDQDFTMRADDIVLEKPYDLAYEPTEGFYLAVAAWDSAELVVLENISTGVTPYEDNWETVGSYTLTRGPNDNGSSQQPENVEWLDNGRGLYLTSNGEQAVSFASFDPAGLDIGGAFDATYAASGGFYNPQGIDALPLVSLVHPRANSLVGGAIEPVVLVRDPTATKVTCSMDGAENSTTSIYAGFAVCPPFNTQATPSGQRHALTVRLETPSGTVETTVWVTF
jgi:hypothetical protein